jgi:uncharacterized protein (UPF0297 family)
MFMVVIILFGIWLLSLIVANLNTYVILNKEDELKAYKSIDKMSTKHVSDEISNTIKYMTLAKKINEPNKSMGYVLSNMPKFIFYQNEFRREVKFKQRSEHNEYILEKRIRTDNQFFEKECFELKYILLDKKTEIVNSIDNIAEKVSTNLRMSEKSKQYGYAINNLMSGMFLYDTVGNVRSNLFNIKLIDVHDVQYKKLIRIPNYMRSKRRYYTKTIKR